jgi:hypothetical protein
MNVFCRAAHADIPESGVCKCNTRGMTELSASRATAPAGLRAPHCIVLTSVIDLLTCLAPRPGCRQREAFDSPRAARCEDRAALQCPRSQALPVACHHAGRTGRLPKITSARRRVRFMFRRSRHPNLYQHRCPSKYVTRPVLIRFARRRK